MGNVGRMAINCGPSLKQFVLLLEFGPRGDRIFMGALGRVHVCRQKNEAILVARPSEISEPTYCAECGSKVA